MSQVFVPSVGLNLQQGQAQQGARVDTGLTRQIDPTENLKPLNHLFDTVSKDLGRWDQMNVQRDALERFDNLQQQLTANRDEFFSKKGQDAIDFAKTYEKNNKETFAKAMDDVDDFRVRNALHGNAKRMYDVYTTAGNSYLTEQTAVANLNQAKASLTQAVNNYIDWSVNGGLSPNAQSDATDQLNAAIDNHSKLTGINPNGVDGDEERKKTFDLIYSATNKHYLTQKAFNTANSVLDAAKAKMNFKTWLEEKDKIYLAQQTEAEKNKASKNGFALTDKSSWIKVTAQDEYNNRVVEMQKQDPNFVVTPKWQQITMAECKSKANLAYDKMESEVNELKSTDGAMKNYVGLCVNYANSTGKIWDSSGNGNQIPVDVLRDQSRILERVPKAVQDWAINKWGTTEEADKQLATYLKPNSGVGGFEVVYEAKHDPSFYSRFTSERDLRAHLQSHGVGLQDANDIVSNFSSEHKKQLQKRITNVTDNVLGRIDSDLTDKKKLTSGSISSLKRMEYEQVVTPFINDLIKADPTISDTDLISKTQYHVDQNTELNNKLTEIDDLENRTDAYREFNEDLNNNYSKEFTQALHAFDPDGYAACMTTDYAQSTNNLMNLANRAVKNKNFQAAHPNLPEVIQQKANEKQAQELEERRKNEHTPFQDDIKSNLSNLSPAQQAQYYSTLGN